MHLSKLEGLGSGCIGGARNSLQSTATASRSRRHSWLRDLEPAGRSAVSFLEEDLMRHAPALEVIRGTKLYDLFAAAPLIGWFSYSAAQMLPSVGHQIALA